MFYSKLNRSLLAAALISVIFIASCKEEEGDHPDGTEGKTLIASGYAAGSGALVKLWANDSLFTGYNKLFVQLLDSVTGEGLHEGHIYLMPGMDMGSSSHSAPYENPTSQYADETDGLFHCAVVFQMPASTGWTLNIAVHSHKNNKEGEVTLPLAVRDPEKTRTHVVTALNDSTPIIISYVEPSEPVVGINDFEMTIHKQESMTGFPPVETYSVEIDPQMPAMGHGSPNNMNPYHTSRGHYDGKVNFTMPGLWRINLLIKQGAEVVDSTAYFDVVL